jgi:hypothetical protein
MTERKQVNSGTMSQLRFVAAGPDIDGEIVLLAADCRAILAALEAQEETECDLAEAYNKGYDTGYAKGWNTAKGRVMSDVAWQEYERLRDAFREASDYWASLPVGTPAFERAFDAIDVAEAALDAFVRAALEDAEKWRALPREIVEHANAQMGAEFVDTHLHQLRQHDGGEFEDGYFAALQDLYENLGLQDAARAAEEGE